MRTTNMSATRCSGIIVKSSIFLTFSITALLLRDIRDGTGLVARELDASEVAELQLVPSPLLVCDGMPAAHKLASSLRHRDV